MGLVDQMGDYNNNNMNEDRRCCVMIECEYDGGGSDDDGDIPGNAPVYNTHPVCGHSICFACEMETECQGCNTQLCAYCVNWCLYECSVCRVACARCDQNSVSCATCERRVCYDCYENGHYTCIECPRCGKICCDDDEDDCAVDGGFYSHRYGYGFDRPACDTCLGSCGPDSSISCDVVER